MQTGIEVITPTVAASYLATSKGNRSLKDAKVKAYSRDMLSGKWALNGESIIFDDDGALIDGHHRLKACVLSGSQITTVVARGVSAGAIKTVDMGASRTVGDALGFHGVKNSNHVNAVVLAIMSLMKGRPRSANPSSTEVFEFVEAYPSVHNAAIVAARKVIPRAGTVIGAISFIAEMNREESTFRRFYEALSTGIPAYPGCPAHVVRERIIRDAASRSKMSLHDVQRLVVAAWAAFRVGRSVKSIRAQKEYGADIGLEAIR